MIKYNYSSGNKLTSSRGPVKLHLSANLSRLASLFVNLISLGFYNGVLPIQEPVLILASFNWDTPTPLNKQL